MDEALRQALEPVLRDLQSAGIDAPRIDDSDWTGDPESPSAMLWSPDGSGTGVYVAKSASSPERVASMADQVQDWAIEELWSHLPTNWPPCPQHPNSHPLKATTQDAAAVWVCPTDDHVVAAIGAL